MDKIVSVVHGIRDFDSIIVTSLEIAVLFQFSFRQKLRFHVHLYIVFYQYISHPPVVVVYWLACRTRDK